jgi:hypothetical protein
VLGKGTEITIRYRHIRLCTPIAILLLLCAALLSPLYTSKAAAKAAADAVVLTTCTQLQNISNNLAASYVLGNDIDCSAAASLNSNTGFAPIGSTQNPFTGSLDGQGFSVINLAISRPTATDVGLFAASNGADISNLSLTNISVSGASNVGGLVGSATGSTITSSSTSGMITGSASGLGGLIGSSISTVITNSSSSAQVIGALATGVGGLIGTTNTTSNEAMDYATGAVSGSSSVGGFVGADGGDTISQSYATGTVTSTESGGADFGGFVGAEQGGTLSNSFASGTVTIADATTRLPIVVALRVLSAAPHTSVILIRAEMSARVATMWEASPVVPTFRQRYLRSSAAGASALPMPLMSADLSVSLIQPPPIVARLEMRITTVLQVRNLVAVLPLTVAQVASWPSMSQTLSQLTSKTRV